MSFCFDCFEGCVFLVGIGLQVQSSLSAAIPYGVHVGGCLVLTVVVVVMVVVHHAVT